MGSKSSGASDDASDYSKEAARIARKEYKETTPQRENIQGRWSNFLGVDGEDQQAFDYSQSPMWGPQKLATENQYNIARDNVIANTARGGAMDENLTNLEIGRANNLTNAAGSIGQDEYNKAYGYIAQAPQTSVTGFNQAAGVNVGLANAEAQQQGAGMQMMGMMGMGAGQYMGSK